MSGFLQTQIDNLYGGDQNIKVGVVGANFNFNRLTRRWEMGPMNQEKVMKHIMQRGSVGMGFTLYRDLFYYAGGVYQPSSHRANTVIAVWLETFARK